MVNWCEEKSAIEDLIDKLAHAVWKAWEGQEQPLEPHLFPLFEQAIAQALSPNIKVAKVGGSYYPVDQIMCWILWGEWGRLSCCTLCGTEKFQERSRLAQTITKAVKRLLLRLKFSNTSVRRRRRVLIESVSSVLSTCHCQAQKPSTEGGLRT